MATTRTLDIRFEEETVVINNIRFADKGIQNIEGVGGTAVGAYMLHRPKLDENFLQIKDSTDFVNICSKQHAKELIKALNKAIELEWLV